MGFNSGNGALSGSSDVALNNPVNANVLSFNEATAKWVNTPSMPLVPTEIYIQPSGDITGVTDRANINAAVASASPKRVILRGHYYINGRIRLNSNTALWGNGSANNIIEITPGASTNMVENLDQQALDNGGVGNTNIAIEGLSFVGHPTQQPATNGQGFLFQNVDGLIVNDVAIGPCRRMAAMHFGVKNARYTNIILNQDRSTYNQDGIDWGPGCSNIEIDGVTGTTGDDCFSIFAKNTGGNTTAYSNSLSPEQRNISDITIRNVTVNMGINPFRLQAGDGSKLQRLKFYNIVNTRPTANDINDNPVGVLGFGNTSYITTLPAAADMKEIVLDGYTGPGSWIIDAQSNFSRVRVNNVNLITSEDTGWIALLGCGTVVPGFTPRFSDISMANINSAQTANAGGIIHLPAGTVGSHVTISNVHAVTLGTVIDGGASIDDCVINDIHLAVATNLLFKATGTYTGFVDRVTIESYAPGVNSAYGTTLGMKLGMSMPSFLAADITPSPLLGSIMISDGTKNPTTDGLTVPGAFMATSQGWKRFV